MMRILSKSFWACLLAGWMAIDFRAFLGQGATRRSPTKADAFSTATQAGADIVYPLVSAKLFG
jgi:hypothetical protein